MPSSKWGRGNDSSFPLPKDVVDAKSIFGLGKFTENISIKGY